MAEIKFTGPNPLDPTKESVTVLTVPDELLLKVVEATCATHGYEQTVPVIKNGQPAFNEDGTYKREPNPVGPGTFTIQKTIEWWQGIVMGYKASQDERAASAKRQEEAAEFLKDIEIKGQ